MDNYFTLSKTMIETTKCGVAAFGTACPRNGWPPEEFKAVKDDRYNLFYYMNNKDNFRIFRWCDNNIVKIVSTIHLGTSDKKVTRPRKRSRINEFNKQGVRIVWGDNHTVEINIPEIVNNYNYWMLGVDVADQMIAYY